ncbi:MAG TPA: cation transporter dimerization domain-containing protein [bacterium]|nr:cation transporter dimerization domain-containing protein [bacterium]
MSFLEIAMLVCFAASWPVSIAKTLRCRNVEGKSVIFLYIIITGYGFGIWHKLVHTPGDWVTWLYGFNACLVGFDAALWHRFSVSSRVRESVQLAVLRELAAQFAGYAQLSGIRTRRVGPELFIEIFLQFDRDRAMAQVQDCCDTIKRHLEAAVAGSEVWVIPAAQPVSPR